jgi:hypothetical protein
VLSPVLPAVRFEEEEEGDITCTYYRRTDRRAGKMDVGLVLLLVVCCLRLCSSGSLRCCFSCMVACLLFLVDGRLADYLSVVGAFLK